MLIGCFVENNEKNKYLEGSFLQAKECNADCFMFYLGAPQTSIRKPIEQLNVEKFKILMEKDNFNFDKVFVHAPYILNLATNEEEIQKFIIDFLIKECKRVSQIGCKYLIVHPGNAVKNMDVNQAILNCANIINSVIEKNNDVCICIETMSGKGSEIGRNFSQISQIIKLVKQKDKIGVCLDTCHIWDSGYDLSNPEFIIEEFEKEIGIFFLKLIHFNDSKNVCGSFKDRHENIGYGKIGFSILIDFAFHPKFSNICKVLETPIYDNLIFTYKNEILNIKNNSFNDWRK